MKKFLFVFTFLILSVVYLKAKTLYSALKQGSLENPLKYPPIELNGEDYSHLFEGITTKIGETKVKIIDIAPAGMVYDFKLFFPFPSSKDQKIENENRVPLERRESEEELVRHTITEENEEEVTEENKDEESVLTAKASLTIFSLANSSKPCFET